MSEDRHEIAGVMVDARLSLQIKALRLQRGWTQKELSQRAGIATGTINAMEHVGYSGWTVESLRKLARAFDLALTIRFEAWSRFQAWLLSSLRAPSWSDEAAAQQAQAATEPP